MRYLLLIFPLLLLAGCGPSSADLVEENRAATEARRKQFETIGKQAATETEIKEIALPEGEKLAFFTDSSESGNAALLQLELFGATPDERKKRLDLIADDHWFEEVPKLLETGGENIHPNAVKSYFDQYLNVKYAVIVRTRTYSEPGTLGEDQFVPGFWGGEVMVYEIDSGEYLGGVQVNATNDEEVDVNLQDPDNWLHSNLWSNTRAAINEALKPHSERLPLD